MLCLKAAFPGAAEDKGRGMNGSAKMAPEGELVHPKQSTFASNNIALTGLLVCCVSFNHIAGSLVWEEISLTTGTAPFPCLNPPNPGSTMEPHL